jgi:tetratricopeptide (TPR) repeat protein
VIEHPEEALDRAVSGDLSAAEQQALDRHLAACAACRAHLLVARSSQQALEPEPWDNVLNRRAIERAMASLDGASSRRGIALRTGRGWALVAAGVLFTLGGVASAAWWRLQRPEEPAAPGPPAVAPAVARAAPLRRPAAGRASQTDDGETREEPPSVAPELTDHRAVRHPAERPPPGAAALFAEASALRERNRPDQAVALFRRLQQLYPRARETRISFALAGRLLLEGGHPAQALLQFDQHLAQGGEAAEEALAGRANALQRMGRPAAESETWRRLLAAYPRTVYARQAQDRLAELGGTPGAP